jgi:hypothetical protein
LPEIDIPWEEVTNEGLIYGPMIVKFIADNEGNERYFDGEHKLNIEAVAQDLGLQPREMVTGLIWVEAMRQTIGVEALAGLLEAMESEVQD